MVQKQFPTFTDEFGLDFLTKAAYPKVDVVDFKDRLEITSEIEANEIENDKSASDDHVRELPK